MPDTLVLVTGATGYIGGRLVPELLEAGYRVRVMTRSPGALRDAPWVDRVEVVRADAAVAEEVARALDGVDVAYYLIHALGTGVGFEDTDRRTARTFARAARAAGTGRIVYLGGTAVGLLETGTGRQRVDQVVHDVGTGARRGDLAGVRRVGLDHLDAVHPRVIAQ